MAAVEGYQRLSRSSVCHRGSVLRSNCSRPQLQRPMGRRHGARRIDHLHHFTRPACYSYYAWLRIQRMPRFTDLRQSQRVDRAAGHMRSRSMPGFAVVVSGILVPSGQFCARAHDASERRHICRCGRAGHDRLSQLSRLRLGDRSCVECNKALSLDAQRSVTDRTESGTHFAIVVVDAGVVATRRGGITSWVRQLTVGVDPFV